MTILRNRRLNGHAYLLTLPVPRTASGSDDLGFLLGEPGLSGSNPSSDASPPSPSAGVSQLFSMTNWGAATSLGLHKRGVWFKEGDLPSGNLPSLSTGTAQFYGMRYWKDGSLKIARMLLRDASLAAGASRSYTMSPTSGSFSASSTATSGVGTLGTALAGHNFKVTFSNVTTNDNTSYGSGAFTASLAAHAGTATRWTVLTTGSVADVWQGWGMAADNASGIADAHLKVNWFITRWKNADASTLAVQVGAEIALDWWSVGSKTCLNYNASLLNGATTVVAYSGVQHPYHSRWLMAVNDGGNNTGTAPWVGATQPTLHVTFDKAYFVSTGLIPPLNTTKNPAAPALPTYTPCGSMEHRANIDGTGGYLGRGVVTEPDATAFMRGDAPAYARARINALAGLGVPYHYRSNRTRTRPGESTADTANTPIVLLMRPKATAYSDFTAQGMPVAVDAYCGGNTPSYAQDGFVPASGGTGVWAPSGDSSHAVSYSYFMALVSGDEWLLEAELDLATNLAHQSIYGYHNYRQNFAISYRSAGVPTDYWTGLLGQFQADNMRALGWSQLIQGHAAGLVPADHIAFGYFQALLAHNGDYIAGVLQYLPNDFAAAGAYYPPSELGMFALTSPWMIALIAGGAYSNFLVTEDTRWKQLGDFAANWTLRNAAAGRWYAFDQYRTIHMAKRIAWDATTNLMLPGEQQPYVQLEPTLVASTGRFTVSQAVYWNSVNQTPPPMTNGDMIVFTSQQQINSQGVIPAGANEGQVGYVVNLQNANGLTGARPPTTPPSFQVAAQPGGAPLTWSQDTSAVNLGWRPQGAAGFTVAQGDLNSPYAFPYLPNWDNYVPIHASVVMLARQSGNVAATQAIRDGVLAFTAPMSAGYYSPYDMVAS